MLHPALMRQESNSNGIDTENGKSQVAFTDKDSQAARLAQQQFDDELRNAELSDEQKLELQKKF